MTNNMFTFDRLKKRFRQQETLTSAIESSDETQRRRFIQTNMLAMVLTIVVCLSEVFPSTTKSASLHLLLAIPVFIGFLACHWIASNSTSVRWLARVWMALGSVALWLDIAISGGLHGHAAPLLFLLPIGSALILGLWGIVALSVANILAIVALAAFDISGPFHAGVPISDISHQASILIVNSVCISVTVIVLTLHNKKIEGALRGSLEETLHISQHDQLTGLLNRKWINECFSQLDESSDVRDIYLIDLDGFKQVNDLHGHAVGDALLKAVSDRLKAVCAPGDRVARLGGDEFLILAVPSIARKKTVLAERIVRTLSPPFYLDDLQVVISGSVGQARFPADARTGEQLMARADMALYAAKMAGRNRNVTFTPELEDRQHTRNGILKRLRSAIEKDQIFLVYQPQFDLSTGALLGFEALARWTDDVLGEVRPDQFVPIAEECGLINDLGERLLRRACLEGKHWANLTAPGSDLILSVNLSPLQLSQSDMASVVSDILRETGFPAHRLVLEVTERLLIANPAIARQQLKKLSTLGVGVALDDFGTGYSSLSYLQSLSLTCLKIDKSFIRNIDKSKGEAFIRAITQLAKALDLKVIAEGVETLEQLEALRTMNCCIGQGNLFSPGIGPSRVLSWVLEGQSKWTDKVSKMGSATARRA